MLKVLLNEVCYAGSDRGTYHPIETVQPKKTKNTAGMYMI